MSPFGHRPKAIVFDLGKVLLEFDYWRAARALAAESDVSDEAMKHLLDQSPLLFRMESGEMTSAEFYFQIQRLTGVRHAQEDFRTSFGDIFAEIEPMIALQRDMRASGIPTYIFSNTNDMAIEHIRRTYPFFAHFDGYVLSYEAGAMKPSPVIYDAVEKMTGLAGPDLLYIDDRVENIETGKARGWQTILHHDHDTTPQLVRSLFA
ncbi:MAG TPA: HAD family phosphatase [Candidatus Limnocylindria bacterium]|jgi:HAD superfamily hydrolase (TIGR01509 family)|nr:HAD family phosphatase [Candidatus Limnocylindria bacterium]